MSVTRAQWCWCGLEMSFSQTVIKYLPGYVRAWTDPHAINVFCLVCLLLCLEDHSNVTLMGFPKSPSKWVIEHANAAKKWVCAAAGTGSLPLTQPSPKFLQYRSTIELKCCF